MIFRNIEGNREFQGRQFYCWRWPIYFDIGFTIILGDNLHCGFSQQHQTGKFQLVISILHACRISISIVSSSLPIKISRGDLRRIYTRNMECSMMSRGFKYFITSVHASILLHYTLVTNEKRGTEFAPNRFFILRVRSRCDFEKQYEESKMRFMIFTTIH